MYKLILYIIGHLASSILFLKKYPCKKVDLCWRKTVQKKMGNGMTEHASGGTNFLQMKSDMQHRASKTLRCERKIQIAQNAFGNTRKHRASRTCEFHSQHTSTQAPGYENLRTNQARVVCETRGSHKPSTPAAQIEADASGYIQSVQRIVSIIIIVKIEFKNHIMHSYVQSDFNIIIYLLSSMLFLEKI